MKTDRIFSRLFVLFLFSANLTCIAEGSYQMLKEIGLGESARTKSLAIDETARRMYVVKDSKILIFNLDNCQEIGQITNCPNSSDFVVAPKFQCGFSIDPRTANLRMTDLRTLKTRDTEKIRGAKKPERIAYNTAQMDLYTLNADNSLSGFEADDGDSMGNIELSGKPSAAVIDPKTRKVFCAIGDKGVIVVIDGKSRKVLNTWAIDPGEGPTTMDIDADNGRIFTGCANGQFVILDSAKGYIVTSFPLQKKIIACAYDNRSKTIQILLQGGQLNVVHEESPENFVSVQTIETKREIRALAVDSKAHKSYLLENNTGQDKILVLGNKDGE